MLQDANEGFVIEEGFAWGFKFDECELGMHSCSVLCLALMCVAKRCTCMRLARCQNDPKKECLKARACVDTSGTQGCKSFRPCQNSDEQSGNRVVRLSDFALCCDVDTCCRLLLPPHVSSPPPLACLRAHNSTCLPQSCYKVQSTTAVLSAYAFWSCFVSRY